MIPGTKKLFFYAAVFGLAASSLWMIGHFLGGADREVADPGTAAPDAGHGSPINAYFREQSAGVGPSPRGAGPAPTLRSPSVVEPLRPYLLTLGPDSATICWTTVEEVIGEVRLFSYDAELTFAESGLASSFHKVVLGGLLPGRVYRYEIGKNHRGTFTTVNETPGFEAVVFGHPGGTAVPDEYPTELLASRVGEMAPELVLCTGDLAYYATLRGFQRDYFDKFGDILARQPIYVAAANHEGRWNGADYLLFRKLFPHDFGSDKGAYYSFDYKHTRFFAVTYKQSAADFRNQVAWLTRALDASDKEFNVVFMGGGDESYYDKDFFFESVSQHRVDLVLGGDGGGTFQEKVHGVDYFFAGDRGPGPYPLYYLRFHPYHMGIQLFFTEEPNAGGSAHWQIYSKKKKSIVARLESKQQESPNYIMRYLSIDQPSTTFDGVHATVDWRYDFDATIQVEWRAQARTGISRLPYHLLKANQKNELRIALPELIPYEDKEYVLDEVIIRLAPPFLKVEDYPIRDIVSDVYLFADE